MTRGKHTCKILKDIRRQIAEANDIEFVTSECKHKGDCLGTCPKCEAEVRYLEQQLRARSLAGKAVALAGISAGLLFMPSCSSSASDSSNNDYDENYVVDVCEDDNIDFGEIVEGEVEIPIPGEVERPAVDDIAVDDIIEYWITDSADVRPQFPGGIEALERFINERYSEEDQWIVNSGNMYITVDRNGKVTDTRGYGVNILGEQLNRIAKQLPDFTPAIKDSKPVPVNITIELWMYEEGVKINSIRYSLMNDKERYGALRR